MKLKVVPLGGTKVFTSDREELRDVECRIEVDGDEFDVRKQHVRLTFIGKPGPGRRNKKVCVYDVPWDVALDIAGAVYRARGFVQNGVQF
jgi:hypothetical protein